MKIRGTGVHAHLLGPGALAGRAAAVLAVAVAIAPLPAAAAATVSGSPQAVSIDAQNSSIEEILAALGRDFHLQYHAPVPLKAEINGRYEGTLRRVVARILEGYNFVVKSTPAGIEVTVLGIRDPAGKTGAPVVAKNGSEPKGAAKAVTPPRVAQQPEPAAAKAPAVPLSQMKVAEASTPLPAPTPAQPGTALSSPTPDTTALVAPPMPSPSDTAPLPSPEARPSAAVPPVPSLPAGENAPNSAGHTQGGN